MTRSVLYDIVHETRYDYTEPVAVCLNQLRMRPQTRLPWVECERCSVVIDPVPAKIDMHPDYFGNMVDSFAIESPHESLTVKVSSRVKVTETHPFEAQSIPSLQQVIESVRLGSSDADLSAKEYVFASPRISLDSQFADYARDAMQGCTSVLDAVDQLTKRIHDDFQYDSTATDVTTTTEDAFEMKAGVCQDFSHVQLACLRSLGVPARYVSGYLRTLPPPGKPRLIGNDESHAWISVYAGAQLGWVDFDPTNACQTGLDHIPVCIGRDYDDISPMRGIVLGGGTTTLSVRVDVAPVESEAAAEAITE
ncbi:transglutaminase family protein [Rhodopirellula halodulae]|uniref:transglutaminase family protein n=1 Tax=Rhodopirellula halodulae TaxID=2894198 RepID=UPI001E3249EC|nr:transglutaminase family protein [Rhodopirellula sp. JC737]MCC9654808.1 transglutaminase family protein [Rhodopirellula sp. JC737]